MPAGCVLLLNQDRALSERSKKMNHYNLLILFGGLAMFLYGMHLTRDGLKTRFSIPLKTVLDRVAGSSFQAFLPGIFSAVLILSGSAVVLITSGLSAAGIIALTPSPGILLGASEGATLMPHLFRLLELKPAASIFVPAALIAGIILLMGFRFKNARTYGMILVGFGILFSGLFCMTSAAASLTETGVLDPIIRNLEVNPFLGFLLGAVTAFVLQSCSAAIGVLQVFSLSSQFPFRAVYSILAGISLGSCIFTAVSCSIGAGKEAQRIGVIHILCTFCKIILMFAGTALLYQIGLLNGIWNKAATPGLIANTNTLFHLIPSLLILPLSNVFANASRNIVKSDSAPENRYRKKLDALNPVFLSTPALAFRSCYDLLLTMLEIASRNITTAFTMLKHCDEASYRRILDEEKNLNLLNDQLSSYLALLSVNQKNESFIPVLREYYLLINAFEQLGDDAKNIAETALEMDRRGITFSHTAQQELDILQDLLLRILNRTDQAVRRRDAKAAMEIEPLEEVVDDLIETLKANHLTRLADGRCSIYNSANFIDMLSSIEHISDSCSNIGVAEIARISPEITGEEHEYIGFLHSGQDAAFNKLYQSIHDEYFTRLNALIDAEEHRDKRQLKGPSSL